MYFTQTKYFQPAQSQNQPIHQPVSYEPTIKLPLRNSVVQQLPYNRNINRSNSKERIQIRGLNLPQSNLQYKDNSQFKEFDVNRNIRTPNRQYTDKTNSKKYLHLNNDFNKNQDFNSSLTPTASKSSFNRSMKASCVNESVESHESSLLQSRQFQIRPIDILKEKKRNNQRSKSKDSFNFRQSLGSLSQQIKNTLKSTLSNQNQESSQNYQQNIKSKEIHGQTEQGYTRYEKTSSFFLSSDANRLKRPSFLNAKKFEHKSETYSSEKQNKPFEEKAPVTSRFYKPTQVKQKNTLGRSSVTSSSVSAKDSGLKHSFVIEPMSPQVRTNKKYDSYNYQKQKKKYDASSFKPQNTSASSSIKTPSSHQSPKTSFLQQSSVVQKKDLSKQRSSLNSNERSSLGQQLSLNDFHLGSVKGQGRFGKFYPAIHKKTGLLVGIKQIKKESLKNMLEQFIQELKIQSFIQHPNIVKLYGYFAQQDNFYLILEYMEQGSLFSFIKRSRKVAQQEASTKLKQVCSAVEYLHENEIIHRDIKPENIVMTCDVCKLCDFGWAVYTNTRRKTYCGTLDYVCPEILEGEAYDQCVDIWAIGVLAFEMIVGKAPFYNISRKQTMKKIMECNFDLPKQLSIKAKQFISKALNKNPVQRQNMCNLIKHEFLN